jgi:hypothetical protein
MEKAGPSCHSSDLYMWGIWFAKNDRPGAGEVIE